MNRFLQEIKEELEKERDIVAEKLVRINEQNYKQTILEIYPPKQIIKKLLKKVVACNSKLDYIESLNKKQ